MAFLPLIPQSTDQLNVSQGNILNNFTILGAIAGNANNSSASINATSGFNWLNLPVQGAIPPAGSSFAGGNVALYNANNATSTQNELYVNKTNSSGVVQIPATASILGSVASPAVNSSGYTFLPSGILLQWGTTAQGGSTTTISFNIAFPTRCIQVLVCPQKTAVTSNANAFSVQDGSISPTGCIVATPGAVPGWSVVYLAIGF